MTLTDNQKANLTRLLKFDLQKMSDHQDDYLGELIDEAIARIETEGITPNEENAEDRGLIRQYAAWLYRSREKDPAASAMPRALRIGLNNRTVHNVSGGVSDDA